MSIAQQYGAIGNSLKVNNLPEASATTYGTGNRFYTLVGTQDGFKTGHTYKTVNNDGVYSWADTESGGNPFTATTDTEMTELLNGDNIGKVAQFIGTTTDTYENGAYYVIEESE